jgi:hypothetical protein
MPIPLRSDFDGSALRRLARQSKNGPQARRLLALAAIDEGATRTEAARIGGVTLQIVRDWVSARSRHYARSEAEVSAFKKSSPPVWRRSPRRQAANRSSSGFATRPGSGRRTRSPGAGPGGAHGPAHRAT